jgi:hypothetical protein
MLFPNQRPYRPKGLQKTMLKRNLTPQSLRCVIGNCPAVYELEDGQLAIIGKKPAAGLEQELAALVGGDEYAIVISRELLANITAQNS